ncbi:hypothetical protein [Variovorax paradoxus]|uniref:hypothetical protein n=1 Tax=Variovorax paradoxus TaxID=34073 RepID=UPI0007859519|nr:hypothetical protein [Variovorax paradoxus]
MTKTLTVTIDPTTHTVVPLEPTPEIIAGAALAVWPTASAMDVALARQAAPIVLMRMEKAQGITADMLAASLATMAPAYRAMLAAAPTHQSNTPSQAHESPSAECIAAWIEPGGADAARQEMAYGAEIWNRLAPKVVSALAGMPSENALARAFIGFLSAMGGAMCAELGSDQARLVLEAAARAASASEETTPEPGQAVH